MNRWAVLDKRMRVIACGENRGRFTKWCIPFSDQTYKTWQQSGKKFVQVFEPVRVGQPVWQVAHGTIRRSSSQIQPPDIQARIIEKIQFISRNGKRPAPTLNIAMRMEIPQRTLQNHLRRMEAEGIVYRPKGPRSGYLLGV